MARALGVAQQLAAEVEQQFGEGGPNSAVSGVRPDAPLAMRITLSFVLMQPSESSRSRLTLVAARSAASRSDAGRSASVVSTTSIVARAGASMPAPLAMPPMLHPSRATTAVLGTVSVVMIASAACPPPDGDSFPAASATPQASFSIGSRTPMSPVEHTATSLDGTPRVAATSPAVATASWYPSTPVQALAPPEFSTTAAREPSSTA